MESACRAVLADDDAQPDAWHLLGLALLHRDAVVASIDAFERARSSEAPAVAGLSYQYRIRFFRSGASSTMQSRRCAAGVSLDDTQPDSHFNLGNTLLAMGRLDEAAEGFEKGIGIGAPVTQPPDNNLGHVLRRRGELKAAIDQFRLAADADNHYAPGMEQLVRRFAGIRADGGRNRCRSTCDRSRSEQRRGALQPRKCVCRGAHCS